MRWLGKTSLIQVCNGGEAVEPSTTTAYSGGPLRTPVQEPAQPGSSVALSISLNIRTPFIYPGILIVWAPLCRRRSLTQSSRSLARGCRLLCTPCHCNTQVFFGLQFAAGDRILTSVQEYGSNYINFLQVTRCITISNHMLCVVRPVVADRCYRARVPRTFNLFCTLRLPAAVASRAWWHGIPIVFVS